MRSSETGAPLGKLGAFGTQTEIRALGTINNVRIIVIEQIESNGVYEYKHCATYDPDPNLVVNYPEVYRNPTKTIYLLQLPGHFESIFPLWTSDSQMFINQLPPTLPPTAHAWKVSSANLRLQPPIPTGTNSLPAPPAPSSSSSFSSSTIQSTTVPTGQTKKSGKPKFINTRELINIPVIPSEPSTKAGPSNSGKGGQGSKTSSSSASPQPPPPPPTTKNDDEDEEDDEYDDDDDDDDPIDDARFAYQRVIETLSIETLTNRPSSCYYGATTDDIFPVISDPRYAVYRQNWLTLSPDERKLHMLGVLVDWSMCYDISLTNIFVEIIHRYIFREPLDLQHVPGPLKNNICHDEETDTLTIKGMDLETRNWLHYIAQMFGSVHFTLRHPSGSAWVCIQRVKKENYAWEHTIGPPINPQEMLITQKLASIQANKDVIEFLTNRRVKVQEIAVCNAKKHAQDAEEWAQRCQEKADDAYEPTNVLINEADKATKEADKAKKDLETAFTANVAAHHIAQTAKQVLNDAVAPFTGNQRIWSGTVNNLAAVNPTVKKALDALSVASTNARVTFENVAVARKRADITKGIAATALNEAEVAVHEANDPEGTVKKIVDAATQARDAAAAAQQAVRDAQDNVEGAKKAAGKIATIVKKVTNQTKRNQPWKAAKIMAKRLRVFLRKNHIAEDYLDNKVNSIAVRISTEFGDEGVPVNRSTAAPAVGGDHGTNAAASTVEGTDSSSSAREADVSMVDHSSTLSSSGAQPRTPAADVNPTSDVRAAGVYNYHCADCNCVIKDVYKYKRTGLCQKCMEPMPKNMNTSSGIHPLYRNSYPLKPLSLVRGTSHQPYQNTKILNPEKDYDKVSTGPANAAAVAAADAAAVVGSNNNGDGGTKKETSKPKSTNPKKREAVSSRGANSWKGNRKKARVEAEVNAGSDDGDHSAHHHQHTDKNECDAECGCNGNGDAESGGGAVADANADGSNSTSTPATNRVDRSYGVFPSTIVIDFAKLIKIKGNRIIVAKLENYFMI